MKFQFAARTVELKLDVHSAYDDCFERPTLAQNDLLKSLESQDYSCVVCLI